GGDVLALAALYAAVGVVHWLVRRPLLALSFGGGRERGGRVLAWDALFYASFALVVTSSVRVAGVLLVFAYLVVPAAIAVLLVRGIGRRLALGWLVGAIVSAAGLVASYRWDLPTGAAGHARDAGSRRGSVGGAARAPAGRAVGDAHPGSRAPGTAAPVPGRARRADGRRLAGAAHAAYEGARAPALLAGTAAAGGGRR